MSTTAAARPRPPVVRATLAALLIASAAVPALALAEIIDRATITVTADPNDPQPGGPASYAPTAPQHAPQPAYTDDFDYTSLGGGGGGGG